MTAATQPPGPFAILFNTKSAREFKAANARRTADAIIASIKQGGEARATLEIAAMNAQAVARAEAHEFEIRKTALLAAASAFMREGNPDDDWCDHTASIVAKARDFMPFLRGESE